MSTSGILKYDKYLTNLGLAFPTGNLIGTMVAPVKSVADAKGNIFVDSDDAINQQNDTAEAVPSNTVDFSVGTPYSYWSKRRALSSFILDKSVSNSEQIVNLRQRETGKLVHRLRLAHEKRVADILTNNSIVTQTADITGTARLDSTAPTLEDDIVVAVNAIQSSTGAMANTIVIPFEAATYAATVDFIKQSFQYNHGMEYVQGTIPGQALKLVGLPPVIKGLKVILSNGRVNNSDKGQAKSITNPWGKNILVGYVPQNTMIDEMAGIVTTEHKPFQVSTERIQDPRGEKILAEWDYDTPQLNMGSWYLMTNVIS